MVSSFSKFFIWTDEMVMDAGFLRYFSYRATLPELCATSSLRESQSQSVMV